MFFNILCAEFNTVTDVMERIAVTPFQISHEGKLLLDICENTDLYRVFLSSKFTSLGLTQTQKTESIMSPLSFERYSM